jgi:RNA polymerase sigma-70 factor (ECF subfamily)
MTWPFSQSDEQAMWRVQTADDHAAFARLVERWEAPIQRLCARMTGDLHRAEDLAQEAFARVFSRRRDYEPSSRFSTWLWRIAINLCHDELRRRQRRPEGSLADSTSEEDPSGTDQLASPSLTPSEVAERLEEAEWVRQALLRLPETQRTVVVLRHYEGLKFAEIAEVLGIPEGTVKSRMFEALERLAVLLRPNRPGSNPRNSP